MLLQSGLERWNAINYSIAVIVNTESHFCTSCPQTSLDGLCCTKSKNDVGTRFCFE